MERVINVLFEIEDKANKIIARASDEKIRLYNTLNQDLAQMEYEIEEQTNHKIKLLKEKVDKELDKELQILKTHSEKQLNEIEMTFSYNHNACVDKIIQQIIA